MGREKARGEILTYIQGEDSFDTLEIKLSEIEKKYSMPESERKPLLIEAFEETVDHFLDDGILTIEEHTRLSKFKQHFDLSKDDLDKRDALTKIAKAAVLREILEGVIPQRISFDEPIPVNLQKGEQMVWAFPKSKYLEDKTRRHYVGGSHGVSVRVMKGVYYRASAFKGYPVETTERVHIDTGWVVVTTKNLYFVGPNKSVRIPYPKIVSFEPYRDGIGLIRDAATAKPQVFVTGDGWFTYNLVTNLSQM